MKKFNRKLIGLILGTIVASCGSDEKLSQSSLGHAGVASIFKDVSQMKVNHFGKYYHFMAVKGPKIGGSSCVYKTSEKLNLCAALPPEHDDTFAKLSLRKENAQRQSPKISSFRNSFEVATYNLGVASLACLQPLQGADGERLYVIGGQIPINHSQTCFANIVCNEKELIEVNGGVRLCSPGISTELGLTYDAKEKRLGMYLKGASDVDDVNFRVHFNGAKLLLETVGKDYQATESALQIEAIEIDVKELRPMIDMLSDEMKKLSSSCFKWDD